MALNNGFASLIIALVFILSTIICEANIAAPPEKTQIGSPSPSAKPECRRKYINRRMISISEKTKEFIRDHIKKRLDNNSHEQPDHEKCLETCLNSYEAAVGSIEKAINDVDVKRYSEANKNVLAYATSIDTTLSNCHGNFIWVNPDFREMQQWAHSMAEDVLIRLLSCSEQ